MEGASTRLGRDGALLPLHSSNRWGARVPRMGTSTDGARVCLVWGRQQMGRACASYGDLHVVETKKLLVQYNLVNLHHANTANANRRVSGPWGTTRKRRNAKKRPEARKKKGGHGAQANYGEARALVCACAWVGVREGGTECGGGVCGGGG